MTEQPLLLSVESVAKLLDCSQSHVWRQSDAGKMPRPVKCGRLKRWSWRVREMGRRTLQTNPNVWSKLRWE